MENTETTDKKKSNFFSYSNVTKYGAYASIITAVALVVLVIFAITKKK